MKQIIKAKETGCEALNIYRNVLVTIWKSIKYLRGMGTEI